MTWLAVGPDAAPVIDRGVLIDPRLDELFGPRSYPKPAPPAPSDRKPTVWVVQQISGGRLRVLAEWHSTAPLPEGAELRFYNQRGADGRSRVATFPAGSWHWCVAESALDPAVKS